MTFVSHWCIIISLSCGFFVAIKLYNKQTDTQYLFGYEYPFFLFLGLFYEPAPSADKHISDAMRFQLEVEAFLPKHFMWEWDCTADFPCAQIYPTQKMEQEARIKAMNRRKNIE